MLTASFDTDRSSSAAIHGAVQYDTGQRLKLCGLPGDQRTLTREQLDALAKRLCRSDQDAADLILRYEPERIHTLVPGLMILRYLADRFDAAEITISRYGVREGYLLQKIQPTLSDRL